MPGVFEAGLVTVGLLILRALAVTFGLSWQANAHLQVLLAFFVFAPLGLVWWLSLNRQHSPSPSSSFGSRQEPSHTGEEDGGDDEVYDSDEEGDDDTEEKSVTDHPKNTGRSATGDQHEVSRPTGYRELQRDDIVLLQEKPLSYGAFSVVYKGEWRGVECAVKQINVPVVDQKAKEEFRKEASLMQELGHHPNICTFFGAVTVGHCMWLVTEYHKMGSIHEFYRKYRQKMGATKESTLPVPLSLLVKLAADAALGVLHLHRENVIHRDIAARNVLVAGSFRSGFRAVISDFGLSRVKSNSAVTLSNIGPVKWMAPEAIVNKEYSEASDAWSFGVLLWEMVTGNIPWEEEDALNVAVKVGKENQRLPLPPECDEVLAELMSQCWQQDQAQRPTFSDIYERLQAYSEELKEEYVVRSKHKGDSLAVRVDEHSENPSSGSDYHPFESPSSEEEDEDSKEKAADFARVADDYQMQQDRWP